MLLSTIQEATALKKAMRIQDKIHTFKPKLSVEDTTKSAVATLTETLPYFELAGYRLEKQNHGAPQCPDITLNEKKTSRTKPQAWSKEIDGQEQWFYNYPGAYKEAEFLRKEVPTIDQWMEMLASGAGNAEEKAKALDIPMVGFRDASYGKFCHAGGYVSLWSLSPGSDEFARYAIFGCSSAGVGKGWAGRGRGMSLRFLADKK